MIVLDEKVLNRSVTCDLHIPKITLSKEWGVEEQKAGSYQTMAKDLLRDNDGLDWENVSRG